MGKFLRYAYPYCFAVLAVAIAVLIRQTVLAPIMGGDRGWFSTFTLAILASAWLGGLWPGLLATALSFYIGWFIIASPAPVTPLNLTIVSIFSLNGILISVVCEILHRSRIKAERSHNQVKEGKEKLREAEEHQRLILNAIPHMVWTTDADGNFTYINQRWTDQLDMSIEQTRNGGCSALIHEADYPRLVEAVDKGSRDKTCYTVKLRVRLRDGGYRWHLVHVDPTKDAKGEIIGWCGTATDIDDTHRVAEAMKISEERFRKLADSVPVLIWVSDTTKACTWVNEAWLQFTERTMNQERGNGWMEGVHPDDVDRCLDVYTKSFDVRQPFSMDYRMKRHDGDYRWILNQGIPQFGVDGVFVGFMGSCVDIHEHKEAKENSEALLKREQAARVEAERTALLKDEFLATVSHEMRTPLTAMLGWVQLLRAGSLPADTVSQALETIERNARAQAKLIDDLLDMSRILSGRIRIDVQSVNIYEAIQAALAAAEPGAAAKKISMLPVLSAQAGTVSGDPIRIQQIIWNLLNNAIKFTPTGGRVTVTLEKVASHIEISVSDTGEGIQADFLPHVFDRFRQQDASTARKHQGMGLGLSIVRQLVELHGGTVRAESPGIGLGATFTVAFPMAAAYPDKPRKQASSKTERPVFQGEVPTLLGLSVLVVDDDDDAREMLRSVLAQSGASVQTAPSAAEAIKQFDTRIPQVLVSDIGMPGKDGYDLIREVRTRSDQQGGKVPALALTAFARSDDRRRAIDAGFHMHLAKPVEPAELVTVVASLAAR